MNCTSSKCDGRLVPMNLLEDQSKSHRYFSKAELFGFSNPNGFRCENAKSCTNTYALDANGDLQLLIAGVRHDYRDDLGQAGDIWEIVDYWEMVSGAVLKDEEEDFPLPTSEDIEDEIIRNDAKRWLDHDIQVEKYDPEEDGDYGDKEVEWGNEAP